MSDFKLTNGGAIEILESGKTLIVCVGPPNTLPIAFTIFSYFCTSRFDAV